MMPERIPVVQTRKFAGKKPSCRGSRSLGIRIWIVYKRRWIVGKSVELDCGGFRESMTISRASRRFKPH